jgi:hypothetical protein
LIAPQTQSDNIAPDLSLNSVIKIPVYKKQNVNLTPYIYENAGIKNIKAF